MAKTKPTKLTSVRTDLGLYYNRQMPLQSKGLHTLIAAMNMSGYKTTLDAIKKRCLYEEKWEIEYYLKKLIERRVVKEINNEYWAVQDIAENIDDNQEL